MEEAVYVCCGGGGIYRESLYLGLNFAANLNLF